MTTSRYLPLGALAAGLLVLPWLLPNSFYLDLAIRMAINAIIVLGLNLLIGFAGQISLGHAGFLGLGVYASAVLPTHFGWPPLAAAGRHAGWHGADRRAGGAGGAADFSPEGPLSGHGHPGAGHHPQYRGAQ